MIPRYKMRVRTLPQAETEYLFRYFELPDHCDLYTVLSRGGYSQADVVLALLRGGYTDAVNTMIEIQHIAPRPPKPLPAPVVVPRIRQIVPPTRKSKRALWLQRMRKGMTRADILATGCPGRVLRWALRRNYIVIR